jgi:hypothetical protein
VGSVDLLPMNDKSMQPPGTISFERDFRNDEKSFWNCNEYASNTQSELDFDI